GPSSRVQDPRPPKMDGMPEPVAAGLAPAAAACARDGSCARVRSCVDSRFEGLRRGRKTRVFDQQWMGSQKPEQEAKPI
ncbi:MAG: hypothetical protein NWR72_17875, partial [Bacteroidia bacterium]|nr:hypothetical protein [Bacteroidia bacterium]